MRQMVSFPLGFKVFINDNSYLKKCAIHSISRKPNIESVIKFVNIDIRIRQRFKENRCESGIDIYQKITKIVDFSECQKTGLNTR